ncbi:hypothetical protein Dimus_038516 [Dionaea muscipula]
MIYSDSQLVVNQVKGDYHADKPNMQQYLKVAQDLLQEFGSFEIAQVPRGKNTQADALSKLGSSPGLEFGKIVFVERLTKKSTETHSEVLPVTDTAPNWMTPIRDFLTDRTVPADKMEARKLRIRAASFRLINGVLYKQLYQYPCARCLVASEAQYVLKEVHEGACGGHQAGAALARKIRLQGYYWPNLRAEAEEYVRRCEPCQKHAKKVHQPATTLNPISAPWPFALWGMDIQGPYPTAPGGRKFLLVAVDYFTKWVEAEPVVRIIGAELRSFLWKNIICRFRVPHTLVIDIGTQFEDRGFQQLCAEYEIQHRFASVAYP